MPGGAATMGAGTYRGFFRFLAIDPETYPLAGVASIIFASAGFLLGRKSAAGQPETQIEVHARPWQDEFPSHKKETSPYTYIPPGGKEPVAAPPSMQSTEIRVTAPAGEGGKTIDLRK
ncbi:hypothetical protein HDU93_005360 [Gonapodya sp. JEL0774]|nr:hypothetical protein HDU93_005360 [Gonapodya sp. JEL0774]